MQVAQAQVDVGKLVPQNIAQSAAEVKQLEGQVRQARSTLAQAEVNLSFTRITAPQDGWVTRRNVSGLDPNRPLPLGLSVVPTVHLK